MHSIQEILKHLNPAQKEAVLQTEGGLLVVAGAGSGKTRVITSRIAYLLSHQNVPADSIIALTFTNKAALEMRQRIMHLVGHEQKIPFVGTFHAYCLLLLRRYKYLTGFDTFSILDAEDQEQLLKRVIKNSGEEKRVTYASVQNFIGQQKNGTLSDLYTPPFFKELMKAYEEEKRQSNALDFDDLMLQVLAGFDKHPEFAQTFRDRIKHILVDEYQDTNKVQHSLLKKMALHQDGTLAADSICAVGDEDQSIYSWRGAAVSNMQDFKKDFAPVSVVKIEQNYRSVQPILDAANGVIAQNKVRIPKELWSEKKAKNRVLLLACQSGYQEADLIVRYIATLPPEIKKSEIAILYRTHYQSRSVEEALIKASVPYHIVGGIRFYERKEIKDLLAYLRLFVNPYDKVSFLRVLNLPTRGLGAKFEEALLKRWESDPYQSALQVLQSFLEGDDALTGVRAVAVKDFIQLFSLASKDDEPSQILQLILDAVEYKAYLKHAYDEEEAQVKIENCRELLNSMLYAEKQHRALHNEFLSTQNFLHEVALLQEKIEADQDKTDSVNLMTVHAVKGLEFNTVFVIGVEEGIMPSSRSLQSAQAIEEERRLLYVAMTRAEERLIISYARQRISFGQFTVQEPSRFLKEIPGNTVQVLDVAALPLSFAEREVDAWRKGQPINSAAITMPQVKVYGGGYQSSRSDHSSSMSKVASIPPRPATIKKSYFSPATSADPESAWKKNETVKHATFGLGIIKQVDKRENDQYFLTIIFSVGEKRILSSFVEKYQK
jgi:DNA helicase-2/ATP-dependent DNA helicase PcrA